MKYSSINQKGFSALEAMLVLLVLTAIGAAGYYVYNNMERTTDTSQAASELFEDEEAGEIVTYKPVDGYLAIDKWEVRMKVPGSMKGLEAELDDLNDHVSLSSDATRALPKSCSKAGWGITSYSLSEIETDELEAYTKIKNSYYDYEYPPADCPEKPSAIESLDAQFKQLFQSLEAM
jgi:hypothetical protein